VGWKENVDFARERDSWRLVFICDLNKFDGIWVVSMVFVSAELIRFCILEMEWMRSVVCDCSD
jgi:hypothetical protein